MICAVQLCRWLCTYRLYFCSAVCHAAVCVCVCGNVSFSCVVLCAACVLSCVLLVFCLACCLCAACASRGPQLFFCVPATLLTTHPCPAASFHQSIRRLVGHTQWDKQRGLADQPDSGVKLTTSISSAYTSANEHC